MHTVELRALVTRARVRSSGRLWLPVLKVDSAGRHTSGQKSWRLDRSTGSYAPVLRGSKTLLLKQLPAIGESACLPPPNSRLVWVAGQPPPGRQVDRAACTKRCRCTSACGLFYFGHYASQTFGFTLVLPSPTTRTCRHLRAHIACSF